MPSSARSSGATSSSSRAGRPEGYGACAGTHPVSSGGWCAARSADGRPPRAGADSAECDREGVEAAEDDPAVPRRLAGRELDAREAAHEGAERNASLGPGERRAEAVVDTAAERHMLARVAAAEIELVDGAAPVRRIAVGGAEAREQEAACFDRRAVELEVA